MFERVLVGIDGAEGGHDAVALASRLLADGGKLTLANVQHPLLSPYAPVVDAGEVEDEAQALLERERDAAEVEAELVAVEDASPGRGLHQLAERLEADLIVVGSTRRGAIARATLGDDARGALNGAPCAVATAVSGYAEHPLPLAKIGVAYNGSAESDAALATARTLASKHHSVLRAMQVITYPALAMAGLAAAAASETVQALVDEAKQQLSHLDGVEAEVVDGQAEEQLVAFSEDLDLLVVGSRGYGPTRRLMLGSVSNGLQRHCHCSLLVLPRATVAKNATSGT